MQTTRARRHLQRLLTHTYHREILVIDSNTRDAHNQPTVTTTSATGPCLYDEEGRFQTAGYSGGVRGITGQPAVILAHNDPLRAGDILTRITARDGTAILAVETQIGVVDQVAPNGDVLWQQAKLVRHDPSV